MRNIFTTLFIVLVLSLNLYSYDSVGYDLLKTITKETKKNQKQMQLYTHLINASLSTISKRCPIKYQSCLIAETIDITVTQEMVDLGLNNLISSNYSQGDILTIPQNSLTFLYLQDNSKYDYKIIIDNEKFALVGSEIFRWSKDGKIKTVTHKESLNNQELTLTFIKDINNTVIIRDKSYDESLTLTLQQYDKKNNGVKLKLTANLVDNSLGNINLVVKAKADKNGGYSHITIKTKNSNIEEIETFDTNGTTIGLKHKVNESWIEDKAIVSNIYDDIEDERIELLSVDIRGLYDTTTTVDKLSYIIVEQNLSVDNIDNHLGYIEFYDKNQNNKIDNNEIFIDYYGDKELIGDRNSIIDSDKLDIYQIGSSKNKYTKLNNSWIVAYSNTDIDVDTDKIDFDIYFSKTSGKFYDGGADNIIIEDIKNAKNSIKLAMYDLTNKHLTQALIDAYNRGVTLQVVTDDDKIDDEKYQELINNGISVVDDQDSEALMHNKILIVDDNVTWVGSANYTVYSFYRNYENIIKINNTDITKVYMNKFAKLYAHQSDFVSSSKIDNVEIHFSPDNDFENRIIELIKHSKNSINILAFAFTNKEISDALIDAYNRGVVIRGVFDEGQNDYQSYSKYQTLLDTGMDMRLDGNAQKLHNKVFIIDNNTTITGSYNFTSKANDKNDENSIVIFDADIASKYNKYFNTIYNEGKN
jgi:hypothetical protein